MNNLNLQEEFKLQCELYNRYYRLYKKLTEKLEITGKKLLETENGEKEFLKKLFFKTPAQKKLTRDEDEKARLENEEKQVEFQMRIIQLNGDIKDLKAQIEYVKSLMDKAYESVTIVIKNLYRYCERIRFKESQQLILAIFYSEEANMMYRVLELSTYEDTEFVLAYKNKDHNKMNKIAKKLS